MRTLSLIIFAGSAALIRMSASSVSSVTGAKKGGSFSWTFKGKIGKNSRQWTTTKEADVYVVIDSNPTCESIGKDGYTKIRVKLFQSDRFGDTHIGCGKTLICSGTAKWSMVDARKGLYFKIEILHPWRDQGKEQHLTGHVYYDGAKP